MNISNDITICNVDDEHFILDAVNEELQNSDVVVIESEVEDNSELSDS